MNFKNLFKNKNHVYILILLLSVSFVLHCAPYLILDTSKYNFYDTDTWFYVGQIDKSKHRETNDGRGITTIGSLLVEKTDTPLDIFNKVGILPPILAVLFAISVYVLTSKLFSVGAGLYSSIFVMFGGLSLSYNSLFGIIDHHLSSIYMCVVLVLSVLIFVKYKSDLFLIPALVSGTILYFTASMFQFYIVIVASILGMIILHYLWNDYKLIRPPLILTLLGIAGLVFYMQFRDTVLFTLLLSWNEPITEIMPTNPVTFLLVTNVMIFIIIYGIYRTIKSKRYDIIPISLLIATVGLAILTFKFQRIEYIFFPFAAIISGYYLDQYISKINTRTLIVLFLTFSIVVSVFVIGAVIDLSNKNAGVGDALLYLKGQEPGVVLAWWDYGYWISTVSGQQPFINPGQGPLVDISAKVFTNTSQNFTPLLEKYNIKYILVSSSDHEFYRAMLYYSKSTVPYEQSHLKELIDGTASNGNIIYNQSGVKVYRI